MYRKSLKWASTLVEHIKYFMYDVNGKYRKNTEIPYWFQF